MNDRPLDQPPSPNGSPPDDPGDEEPAFDLRRGLRVLLIVGAIVTIISVFCIGLDGRYG